MKYQFLAKTLSNFVTKQPILPYYEEDELFNLLDVDLSTMEEHKLKIPNDWKLSVKKVPREIVKQLAICSKKYFSPEPWRIGFKNHPLHIAASNGSLSLCKHIIDRTANLNPRTDDGHTPFHFAAQKGHFEVCKLFIEVLDDKNPSHYGRYTPLHIAAKNGYP